MHLHTVPAILGGACSHETLAFTDMAEQAKTVVLSYCSIASEISNAGDYIFRNNPSAPHLARFAAKYIKKVAGKERLAILYVNESYGISVADELAKYFTESGGQVVAQESTNKQIRTSANRSQQYKRRILMYSISSDTVMD